VNSSKTTTARSKEQKIAMRDGRCKVIFSLPEARFPQATKRGLQTSGHCGRDPQSFVDASKIVVHGMDKYAADIGRWIIVLALAGLFVAGVWEAYFYRREIFLAVLLWVAVLADLWKYWIVPLTLLAVYVYHRKSARK